MVLRVELARFNGWAVRDDGEHGPWERGRERLRKRRPAKPGTPSPGSGIRTAPRPGTVKRQQITWELRLVGGRAYRREREGHVDREGVFAPGQHKQAAENERAERNRELPRRPPGADRLADALRQEISPIDRPATLVPHHPIDPSSRSTTSHRRV